jgi:hypothetical protein
MPITQQIQMAYGFVNSPPTNSLWAWYEPSREIGYSNGDPITPLTDQTGNSRNYTQATSGTRPTYDTGNALNGLAVANFSTSRFWSGPDMSALGTGGATNGGQTLQGHAFCVVKSDQPGNGTGGTARELWQLSSSGAGAYYPYSDGNIYEAALKGSREDALTSGVTLNAWRVYEVQMKCSSSGATADGTYFLRLDGTAFFTRNGNGLVGAGWPASPTLGKGVDGTFFTGGLVAGLYLYSTQLTGATNPTRAAVISYINGRFGLSSS